jgi:hypothetical protein
MIMKDTAIIGKTGVGNQGVVKDGKTVVNLNEG